MGRFLTRAFVGLVFLLTFSACAFALNPSLDISQYAHTQWEMPGRFLRGQMTSIAQTPDGYLWLGTAFGLLRFDGVQFVPWSPPAGAQLPGNFVSDLLVARDGTLWIATWKGLASWNGGKLTQYPEIAGKIVISPVEDRQGTVWVGVYGPGRLCAIRAGKMQCYGAGRFGGSVSGLYVDHQGNLWVSAQTGLWRWAPGPPEHYTFPGAKVEAFGLIEGDHHELLIATAVPGAGPATTTGSIEGLRQLVDGQIRRYALPGFVGHFRPKCLFRSSDDSLWIGTVQGLLHLHQGRIDKFTVADGLSGEVVTSIFEDREGSVWVSTEDGLNRFREFAVPTISAKQGLSNSSVHLVEATPDGSIWIGTADGLNRWQMGHVTVFGQRSVPGERRGIDDGDLTLNRGLVTVASTGLPGTPRSLGQDNQGRLLASTPEGVFYFERGRFTRMPGLPGGDIFSIAGDDQGRVWISKNDEGLFYSTPKGAVQCVPWVRLGHKGAALALLPDRLHGGLWLGFFDGGIAYLKDGQIRDSYTAADGLGNGTVYNFQLSSDGAIWAATDGGLSRIRDGRVTTLTSKNGLPCDDVFWAIEDNDHAFWLSTGCGLLRIAHSELNAWVSDSKRAVQTRFFDSRDGMRGRYGRYGPKVAKALDGKLWFAALDGVSVIDPRHLPFNKLPAPVHIEQITADGKLIWQNSQGAAPSNFRLPALTRDLEIAYTGLSFVAPEKNQFRYKLEGYDHGWIDAGNRRQAFYTNVAPRKYRFRVMASNDSDVWNEAGASLDFSVDPAYYQTNWFRVLCVAIFLTMIWAIYQLRVRVLERHQREMSALNERLMKAQEEERMRIAGELHDGVLQQLTSLTLRLGTATLKLPADSETKTRIRDLQKDLIQVGAEIRHLSHELHPVLLQEAGLSAALCSYCEEFSKVRGIPVSCDTDESVADLSPGAALCIYRIAQEALGNVAKHSRARQVEVQLSRSDASVNLSVFDDGVGFDPNQNHKAGGLGLINMRERAHQLNGTFEFDSEPGRGTTVRVAIPLRRAS